MQFWQRRPPLKNLIGIALAVVAWLLLELGADALLSSIGIPRERASLLPLLIATVLVTKLYDRMPMSWAGLGLHRWLPREVLLGVVLGAVMATLAWAPGAVVGTVDRAPVISGSIVSSIIVYFAVGATIEELIFRGYLFQRFVELSGPTLATIAASALFAIAHLWNPSIGPVAVMNIFLASVFFSLCYFVTGSLWLPIAAHAAWNMTLALAFGEPVSGVMTTSAWLVTDDHLPVVIGGGEFGPEGGLVATAALAIGILSLLRVPWFTLSPYVHAKVFASVYRREQRRLKGT